MEKYAGASAGQPHGAGTGLPPILGKGLPQVGDEVKVMRRRYAELQAVHAEEQAALLGELGEAIASLSDEINRVREFRQELAAQRDEAGHLGDEVTSLLRTA